MRTALRKMGNSTGMIVPKAILGQLGVAPGTAMELSVEGNRIIATPIERAVREGWAAAAEAIGSERDAEAETWQGFAGEDDADLAW